jgi:hypothetical protein
MKISSPAVVSQLKLMRVEVVLVVITKIMVLRDVIRFSFVPAFCGNLLPPFSGYALQGVTFEKALKRVCSFSYVQIILLYKYMD